MMRKPTDKEMELIRERCLKGQDAHNKLMVALETMLPPEHRIYKETTLWDDYVYEEG